VKTADIIKKNHPKTHYAWRTSYKVFPKEAVELQNIDSIILGDGEKAFCQLAKALAVGKSIEEITGVYTKNSIIKHLNASNNKNLLLYDLDLVPAYTDNLDDLPFPARRLISHLEFFSTVGVSKKFTTIVSSRGCPYHCTFCDVPHKKYRSRSIKNIVDEIEDCIKQGYEEFHFYDDMFNITPNRIIEFSNEVLARKLKFTWDFRGRVNTITKESLLSAKKAGLRMISFGVETGTDEGLKYIKKETTIKMIKNAFQICNDLKIKTVADYMLGFQFEKTKEDIKKSIDFCISIKPTYANFGVLTLFPKTPVYYEAIEKKLINPQRWADFCKNPTKDFYLDYWEEFFTRKELFDMQQEAFERFFFKTWLYIKIDS
jgi:radical SAM superfamily enzyme YgiQ (UPF0313 family)